MNKKILIITPKFYPSIWWIEEQVKLLWENLITKWYWIDILTNNLKRKYKNYDLIKSMNIYRYSSIFFYFSFIIKNRNKYDYVISRQYYKNSFLLWLLKLFKILNTKTIIIWDGWTINNEIEIIKNKLWILSKLYFYIIWKNNFLVWNNKYFLHSLNKYFPNRKNHKIYNGINISTLVNRRIKHIKNILYISRFDEWKWFLETIEAFKKIKNPNIQLNIVWYWDINTESHIKKMIINDKRIIYHWKKYWEEKNNLLLHSDLLVFPTTYIWESFWVVLYEAVKYNIPIISTDFWDTKDIFGKNILYVKNNNINDLQIKIEWIIKNIDIFSYNYSDIIRHIDVNHITDQILKLK